MKDIGVKLISAHLRDIADKLDAGTCKINMKQAEYIISTFTHIEMTKEEVCDEFNISRATFDRYVSSGYIPKGIKVKHKTNLVWYKDEVEQGLNRLKR